MGHIKWDLRQLFSKYFSIFLTGSITIGIIEISLGVTQSTQKQKRMNIGFLHFKTASEAVPEYKKANLHFFSL